MEILGGEVVSMRVRSRISCVGKILVFLMVVSFVGAGV